ncbi:MAG: hypothetical protein ACE5KV_03320 [Thermoplasmata archaeon]
MDFHAWGEIDSESYPELLACTQPMIGEEPNMLHLNSGGILETNPSWNSSIPSYARDGEFVDIDDDGGHYLVVANSAYIQIAKLVNGTELVYLNEGEQ